MTAAVLLAAQVALHAAIKDRAIELGYDPAKVNPVYDGVVDEKGYVLSSPKLMWILKEPYDDFNEKGRPQGGGWTMFRDPAPGKTLADSLNCNAALRNVTYASYAIQAGVSTYADLSWITESPVAYENAVRRIAYANIGKMPGQSTTPTDHLRTICGEWKDILFKQIDLYDPDVLIVCGTDTLQALNEDFGLDLSKPSRTITRGKAVVDIHAWRGNRLLWAPHPAAHIRPEDWVDAVIEAAIPA